MPWARVKHNVVLKLYDQKPECPPDVEAQLFEVGPAVKKWWKKVGNNFVPPEPGERPLAPEIILNLPPLPDPPPLVSEQKNATDKQ